jgi:hypothetical protein
MLNIKAECSYLYFYNSLCYTFCSTTYILKHNSLRPRHLERGSQEHVRFPHLSTKGGTKANAKVSAEVSAKIIRSATKEARIL